MQILIVMSSIQKLDENLTVIMVAHRLSTIKHCDNIIEVSNGKVVCEGSYDELVKNSPSFRSMIEAMES